MHYYENINIYNVKKCSNMGKCVKIIQMNKLNIKL